MASGSPFENAVRASGLRGTGFDPAIPVYCSSVSSGSTTANTPSTVTTAGNPRVTGLESPPPWTDVRELVLVLTRGRWQGTECRNKTIKENNADIQHSHYSCTEDVRLDKTDCCTNCFYPQTQKHGKGYVFRCGVATMDAVHTLGINYGTTVVLHHNCGLLYCVIRLLYRIICLCRVHKRIAASSITNSFITERKRCSSFFFFPNFRT